MQKGKVYLVGAGPGDPELLTLRAARTLSMADVVVYDRLVHPHILRHAKPHARLLYVGKEGGADSVSQSDVNALLVSQARLRRVVVRLKGGDPFVFGRGAEEALALESAHIDYEVVPGVSSGTAVPASAGIPVTHRNVASSVTFATATLSADVPDWKHLAGAPTLVLFMAGARLNWVAAQLKDAGLDSGTPAAVIEAGTWEHQRVIEGTLRTIADLAAEAQIGSPALVVFGDVVRLRAQLPCLSETFESEPADRKVSS